MSTESVAYLKGSVFRLWADYWLYDRQHQFVPPLHALREGPDHELFFVSALTDQDVAEFLNALAGDREVAFAKTSDWMLGGTDWLRSWAVFIARRKR